MDKKPPVLGRRLSGIDAAFLYLERKEIPLNIAAVGVFDGPIPFREFVANIDSRLDLVPRYRQVAVPPPFNLGYPTWEYDPDFDIRRHIFHVRLPAPGGETELEELASRLLSQVLDRGKPLWEIHVVDGLQDGRGALIVRIHHALADGVAGAALLRIMLDPTPEVSHPISQQRTRSAVPPRVEHTLGEQIGGAIQSALENVVAAEAGLLSLAEGLLSDGGKSALQDLAALLPELLQPPERFPFNKPCSGERKFCWTEVDFSQVQAIRAALGGKVNDCVLSVVVRADRSLHPAAWRKGEWPVPACRLSGEPARRRTGGIARQPHHVSAGGAAAGCARSGGNAAGRIGPDGDHEKRARRRADRDRPPVAWARHLRRCRNCSGAAYP